MINNTLWMGDIYPWMTEQFIIDSFNKFEKKISGVKFIKDKKTNKIKNYCFIIFPNIQNANDALLKLKGKQIPNTQLKFKLNWANYNNSFNKSVYVGNLKSEINNIELYNFFKKKYDSVHFANVVNENGVSKCFGFVNFTNENDYLKCLNEMNGINFHGNFIKVKEQKKKEENELLNYNNNNHIINNINNNNINLNAFGNLSNSFSTNTQSLSNSSSGSLSLLDNINSINFYPKNKNVENLILSNSKILNVNSNNNISCPFSFNKNIDILDKLDESNLYIKIKQAIESMKEYYNNCYMGDKSKIKSKLFYFINFSF